MFRKIFTLLSLLLSFSAMAASPGPSCEDLLRVKVKKYIDKKGRPRSHWPNRWMMELGMTQELAEPGLTLKLGSGWTRADWLPHGGRTYNYRHKPEHEWLQAEVLFPEHFSPSEQVLIPELRSRAAALNNFEVAAFHVEFANGESLDLHFTSHDPRQIRGEDIRDAAKKLKLKMNGRKADVISFYHTHPTPNAPLSRLDHQSFDFIFSKIESCLKLSGSFHMYAVASTADHHPVIFHLGALFPKTIRY